MVIVLTILGIHVLYIWFQAMEQVKKLASKGKRSSHSSPNHKQGKLVKPIELKSSSTHGKREETDSILSSTQVPSANQLPTKIRSRWKKHIQKPLSKIDTKISENVLDGQPNLPAPSLHNRELNLKVKYVPLFTSLCNFFLHLLF